MKHPTTQRNTRKRSLRTLMQGSVGALLSSVVVAAQPYVLAEQWKLAVGAALTALLAYATSVAQNAMENAKRNGLPQEED